MIWEFCRFFTWGLLCFAWPCAYVKTLFEDGDGAKLQCLYNPTTQAEDNLFHGHRYVLVPIFGLLFNKRWFTFLMLFVPVTGLWIVLLEYRGLVPEPTCYDFVSQEFAQRTIRNLRTILHAIILLNEGFCCLMAAATLIVS
ncbi:hypothetical protein Sango_2420200 [Sesamum angolense]|uniref:Uncharacterized protein n=1 Tax=Sesamum angolense TaxID=2727404 RepID=A0AAE1W7G8_9LAMI|nr:hypothetical protein Sango_2420200 [Sesamum angolense]